MEFDDRWGFNQFHVPVWHLAVISPPQRRREVDDELGLDESLPRTFRLISLPRHGHSIVAFTALGRRTDPFLRTARVPSHTLPLHTLPYYPSPHCGQTTSTLSSSRKKFHMSGSVDHMMWNILSGIRANGIRWGEKLAKTSQLELQARRWLHQTLIAVGRHEAFIEKYEGRWRMMGVEGCAWRGWRWSCNLVVLSASSHYNQFAMPPHFIVAPHCHDPQHHHQDIGYCYLSWLLDICVARRTEFTNTCRWRLRLHPPLCSGLALPPSPSWLLLNTMKVEAMTVRAIVCVHYPWELWIQL